jgi:hypothetical protein
MFVGGTAVVMLFTIIKPEVSSPEVSPVDVISSSHIVCEWVKLLAMLIA